MSIIQLEEANFLSQNLIEISGEMKLIWIPIIVSLLSSSVIVGALQFVQWNKNKKLENITIERKKWRDTLRDIVEEIEKSNNIVNLNHALTKLKIRINPKGMLIRNSSDFKFTERSIYVKYDCYLWEIIEIMDNAKDFSRKKRIARELINAISILLKKDWDESKSEVRFSKYSVVRFWFYFLFTTIIVLLVCLYRVNYNNMLINLILFLLIPLFVPYIRYLITKQIDRDKKICSTDKS